MRCSIYINRYVASIYTASMTVRFYCCLSFDMFTMYALYTVFSLQLGTTTPLKTLTVAISLTADDCYECESYIMEAMTVVWHTWYRRWGCRSLSYQ